MGPLILIAFAAATGIAWNKGWKQAALWPVGIALGVGLLAASTPTEGNMAFAGLTFIGSAIGLGYMCCNAPKPKAANAVPGAAPQAAPPVAAASNPAAAPSKA